jgi:hypothetical protein
MESVKMFYWGDGECENILLGWWSVKMFYLTHWTQIIDPGLGQPQTGGCVKPNNGTQTPS